MSARRPPKLKRLAQLVKNTEAASAAQRQADELTADGYPPGHPLRALCLLASGDAGRTLFAFEQTQTLLKKKP